MKQQYMKNEKNEMKNTKWKWKIEMKKLIKWNENEMKHKKF